MEAYLPSTRSQSLSQSSTCGKEPAARIEETLCGSCYCEDEKRERKKNLFHTFTDSAIASAICAGDHGKACLLQASGKVNTGELTLI